MPGSAPMPSAGSGAQGAHWDRVYATHPETAVSWYQPEPSRSLEMIAAAGVAVDDPIIDIGGGTSTLVDHLAAAGYRDLTVLDLSAEALAVSRKRLNETAFRIAWICADITTWHPTRHYAVWHDRATFHFLTEAEDRRAYVATLHAALRPAGTAVIATFAIDGPERCSGLPVRRYSPAALAGVLGDEFALVRTATEDHRTPAGQTQRFLYCRFRRI